MAWSNYPKGMTDAAKRGRRLNEEHGSKCATPVGRETGRILANREPLSNARVKRMHAFLSRAETYYKPSDPSACGTISFLLWGGPVAKRWAARTVEKMEKETDQRAAELRKKYGDTVEVRTAEIRAADDGDSMTVEGYAAVFNEPADITPHLREVIEPGAFSDVLTSDVRLLLNHEGAPLARTTSGTLTLTEDSKGLHYRATLSDTTAGRDLYTMIKRGDISESSFAFTIGKETRSDDNTRHVVKVAELLDVSPVTYAAYGPITSVQARERQDAAPTFEPEHSKPEKMKTERMSTADLQQTRAAKYEEMSAVMAGIESEDRAPLEAEAAKIEELRSEVAKLDAWLEMRKGQADAVKRMAHVGTTSTSEAQEVRAINKRFSLSRAVMQASTGRPLVGAELEWSLEGQKEARSAGVTMEGQIQVPSFALAPERRAIQATDNTAGSETYGGGFVSTDVPEFIGGLYQRPVLERAGMRWIQASGNIQMPAVTTEGTATLVTETVDSVEVHNEDGATTDATPTLNKVSLAPQRVAGSTVYTKQLLAQGGPEVDSFLTNELAQAIATKIDSTGFATIEAGLTGSGTAFLDFITASEAALVAAGVELGGSAVVAGSGAHVLARTQSLTGDGGAAAMNGSQFLGYNYLATGHMTSTAAIFGRFDLGAIGAYFGGIDILVDPYSTASNGTVTIYANRFFDVAVRQAGAFKLSGTIAS